MTPFARLFTHRRAADRARADAAREVTQLEAELSELPTRTFGRAELPSGTAVRIASPCKERWESMVGDERVRHCSRCDQDVYNLSGLRADEVEAMLADRRVRCVRLFRREDGTMLTADCPVGRPQRLAIRVLAAIAITVGATAAAEYLSRRLHASGRIQDGGELLGDRMPTS